MNIDLERNKLFPSSSETQHNNHSEIIVIQITTCLTSCDQCTGMYEDSVKGDIIRVICHHQCHSNEEVQTSHNDSKIPVDNDYNSTGRIT
jgi:hypothetical protein